MPYKRRGTRDKSARKHRKSDVDDVDKNSDPETRSSEGDNNCYSTDTTITLIYYYINRR